MIRNYYNHKLQTHPWLSEEEPTAITRHQKDKLGKATNFLFPFKMITTLEWALSNVQQNIEQLQTPTMGIATTLQKKLTTLQKNL